MKPLRKGFSRINLAPFATIWGVLLVVQGVFLLPQPGPGYNHEVFVLKKLPYDLSSANWPVNRVIVTISKGQKITLDRIPTDLETLMAQMKSSLDRAPEKWHAVIIKASKELDYGFVVKVIDAVKEAGAARVELQIDYLSD